MNTAEDILGQLDNSARQFSFPALDNGYIDPADVRLSIYRDAEDWLMIIEHLGTNPRTGGFNSIQNCLHLYGSNLHRPPGMADSDFLFPVKACPDSSVFDDRMGWYVINDTGCIMVRDKRVQFDISDVALKRKGIELGSGEKKDGATLLRSLLAENRQDLLASDEQLAQRNPGGLPLWVRLDEWYHPNVLGNERPSDCETFQMLADTIATGETTRYRPTKPPNTHWKNWPEGGTL